MITLIAISSCNPNLCQNEGTCSIEASVAKCNCTSQWIGELCTISLANIDAMVDLFSKTIQDLSSGASIISIYPYSLL